MFKFFKNLFVIKRTFPKVTNKIAIAKVGGLNKTLTETQRQAACELYRLGVPTTLIINCAGISVGTLHYHLGKNKVPIRRKTKKRG